jgi:hypothetical protein
MASLDAVEALFFTLVCGAMGAEGIILSEKLPIGRASVFRDFVRTSWVRSRISSSTSYASRETACGWSNSTTMRSTMSGRALIQRDAPAPLFPSSACSIG